MYYNSKKIHKGIKHKNIKILKDRLMISYSIEQAWKMKIKNDQQ